MPAVLSKFGEPLLTRRSEIKIKSAASTTLYPLEVMGKYRSLKQIRIRIGLPVYRIENGRTRTFQKEYIATHDGTPSDLFTADPDSLAAQRAQHEILRRLAADEDLLKEFQSGTQQTEPVIVTSTGVVVNGNRRLCVWRILYEKDPEKFKYFEFIEAAILPEDCDEAEIRALEKRLQTQKTHRAEYKWHSKAAMMKEDREAGVPPEQLTKPYDVSSKKDVDILIGALEYADIYLGRIGKPDQWSLVDEDEFAFKAMVEERKKISDQGKKELFEAVCFKLIETKDYHGRLYSVIPDIAQNLDAIAAVLRDEGLLPQAAAHSGTGGSSQENGPSLEEDEDIDLLGGESMERDTYSELASAVQTSGAKLGDIVKQVSDEQKALKNDQKNAKYLLKTLSSVSRSLWEVLANGLNENTVVTGAKDQLDTIKEHLSAIEQWLDEHQDI